MKILRKRLLKVVPVWLIIAILLSAGTAFAAINWISNILYSTSTVTLPPITLSGSVTQPLYKDLQYSQNLTYTVNSGTPTGYVIVKIHGNITAIGDADCYVYVYSNSGNTKLASALVSNTYSLGEITFVEGSYSGGFIPYNFGSTDGKIEVQLTYHVLGNVQAVVQVSSTAS
jgi:hypothetical protein